MKIRFYTPAYGVSEEFGAATLGFAGYENEELSHSVLCPADLNGEVICGSYEDCLRQVHDGDWKVGIVLMGNAGGENAFVRTLSERLNIPLVGGSAAIDPVSGKDKLLYGKGEAAVFLIDDARYRFEVCCENIHHDILSGHDISFTDARWIDKIDGCDPVEWLREKKEALGLSPDDFEHLTFTDENGINVHLSKVDGRIFSGRDLSEHMYLRYVPKEEVQKRIQAFYDDKDAIVFGCAGLKNILHAGLHTEGIGLFMFGEVCTVKGCSDFGNLMLSKLRIYK